MSTYRFTERRRRHCTVRELCQVLLAGLSTGRYTAASRRICSGWANTQLALVCKKAVASVVGRPADCTTLKGHDKLASTIWLAIERTQGIGRQLRRLGFEISGVAELSTYNY